MAEMTRKDPTQARELELMRRGIGSFDDFSKYLESQRTVPNTNLTTMDGSSIGRGLDFSAEGISRGLAPARRAIGRGILNPLASLQDLIAVPASTAEALISKGLGGVSSALGATDVGQFFLDQGDKGFDRASSKLSEALGPGQVIKPLDGTLSPADNEQLLDIFGPDPSIGRPKGMVPGKATIKPGTEGLPKKQIPDPSSNVDALQRFLKEGEKIKSGGRGRVNEELGERDMFQRAKAGPTPEEMALMEQAREQGQGGAELKEETVQNLFEKSMEDLLKMQGNQPKTENREELLEKYKQEFADATGVDISGKPDTSQALMAMGLSLMQNRAGKGFNVGKMLSAVGDAGQKAMPYVTKAASEAKAASLAAGKYALDRIKDGEASAAAFAKEVRAHNNAWNLEVMKLDAQAQIEAMKAKNDKSRNKLQNIKSFKIGAGDVEIQTGTFEDELGSRPVFVNGAADAGRITDAYKKYTEGQEYIVEMQDALTELSNRPEGPLPAKLIDKIKTFSVKLGLADPKAAFCEEGVSKEAEFEVY